MEALTKSDISMLDGAASQVGFYQPYDVPVEKLPLYLLIALCQKVSSLESQLAQSNIKIVELDTRIIDLEKRVSNTEENVLQIGAINNGVVVNG